MVAAPVCLLVSNGSDRTWPVDEEMWVCGQPASRT